MSSEQATGRRIYLDNAATSWPKPPEVYDAIDRYQRVLGAPAGRSTYREAAEVERLVSEARSLVAQLIGASDPRRIIFTANGTDSLNLALQGLLQPGDHVVTTVTEHNSVLRPLSYLEASRDVQVTRVTCDRSGLISVEAIRQALTPRTRLIVLCHVSNVTGAIQPASDIGQLARQHGVRLLLDAAQSLGHLPIDVGDAHVDLLAAPGHKGLLGPLGTGILYVAPGVERELSPIRQGGTGTQSELERQPDSLPDRYESGNQNVPGILGLGAGVKYLLGVGVESVRRHQSALMDRLLDGLPAIAGVTAYGPASSEQRAGVVSLTMAGYDPQEVASLLDAACSIQVRSGLHCAPLMHRSLGTADRGGTVRFSVGAFNTISDIEDSLRALEELASSGMS